MKKVFLMVSAAFTLAACQTTQVQEPVGNVSLGAFVPLLDNMRQNLPCAWESKAHETDRLQYDYGCHGGVYNTSTLLLNQTRGTVDRVRLVWRERPESLDKAQERRTAEQFLDTVVRYYVPNLRDKMFESFFNRRSEIYTYGPIEILIGYQKSGAEIIHRLEIMDTRAVPNYVEKRGKKTPLLAAQASQGSPRQPAVATGTALGADIGTNRVPQPQGQAPLTPTVAQPSSSTSLKQDIEAMRQRAQALTPQTPAERVQVAPDAHRGDILMPQTTPAISGQEGPMDRGYEQMLLEQERLDRERGMAPRTPEPLAEKLPQEDIRTQDVGIGLVRVPQDGAMNRALDADKTPLTTPRVPALNTAPETLTEAEKLRAIMNYNVNEPATEPMGKNLRISDDEAMLNAVEDASFSMMRAQHEAEADPAALEGLKRLREGLQNVLDRSIDLETSAKGGL